jgi:hypothetical protein
MQYFAEEQVQLAGGGIEVSTGQDSDTVDSNPKSPKTKRLSYTYDLDYTLLMEVTTINPFKNASGWRSVSINVTTQYRAISKDPEIVITPKSCRERTTRLLSHLEANSETLKMYVENSESAIADFSAYPYTFTSLQFILIENAFSVS